MSMMRTQRDGELRSGELDAGVGPLAAGSVVAARVNRYCDDLY